MLHRRVRYYKFLYVIIRVSYHMLDISTISNPHCLFVSDEYHADELCEL